MCAPSPATGEVAWTDLLCFVAGNRANRYESLNQPNSSASLLF